MATKASSQLRKENLEKCRVESQIRRYTPEVRGNVLQLLVGLTVNCRFMSSEADLDADIKSLSILSEHPELYEEFAKLGCVSSLISLLSHENTDIAIDAIEIIDELTDQDVVAEQAQWDALVDALVSPWLFSRS